MRLCSIVPVHPCHIKRPNATKALTLTMTMMTMAWYVGLPSLATRHRELIDRMEPRSTWHSFIIDHGTQQCAPNRTRLYAHLTIRLPQPGRRVFLHHHHSRAACDRDVGALGLAMCTDPCVSRLLPSNASFSDRSRNLAPPNSEATDLSQQNHRSLRNQCRLDRVPSRGLFRSSRRTRARGRRISASY